MISYIDIDSMVRYGVDVLPEVLPVLPGHTEHKAICRIPSNDVRRLFSHRKSRRKYMNMAVAYNYTRDYTRIIII